MTLSPRGLQLELGIAAAIVLLDQATKTVVKSRFALHDTVPVIQDLFNLTRVHNTGAAFGLMNAVDFPFKTLVLALIAAFALGALAVYGATLPPDQRLARLGLSFIVGGAAGNLIDRLWLGYVVDFFDFYWGNWHFWAFNIADASITVGVALMILDLLGIGRHRVPRTV